jgi:hypothetical protein
MMTLLEAALRYHRAGRIVLPNNPVRKHPDMRGWQTIRPTEQQIRSWYRRPGFAIGLRDVEGLDFDNKGPSADELYQAWKELCDSITPGLADRLLLERTPGGGYHTAWDCPVMAGNVKLATRPPTEEELKAQPQMRFVTLIETRGRGGQFQVAPSPGYELIRGDWADLPTIKPEERQLILDCAKALTQADNRTVAAAKGTGERPGDRYNEEAHEEALALLLQAGWRKVYAHGNALYLCRPGKPRGVSATFGYIAPGIFYVFSSNASPFEPEHAYQPFAIYTELVHGGDYKAAARALHERYGSDPIPKVTRQIDTATGEIISDEPSPEAEEDTRPTIDVSMLDLPTVMPQAWDALARANDPPSLFRRAGELVRLEETESGALIVKTMDNRKMLGALARAARWIKVRSTQLKVITRETTPPAAVVDDAMVNIDERIPAITRVVYAPTFAEDSTLLTTPGYHAAARIYYDPKVGAEVPPVPDEPVSADLERARDLILNDLLIDFPFVSEADQAHAIALFLLPFVRELIHGPTPLHLIEAPTMGSGKGLLADALLLPALGDVPSPMAEAASDEEWRKLITSNLLAAPAAIYIDNLNRMLASGALAAALTAREFSDRVLGRSEQVYLPVRCVWVATANNPTLSTEISRRCIRIRIDPRMDKPWQREQFKHPKLRSWIEQNRGELIWAALVTCRYGLQHGIAGSVLGSYESWSDILGRILQGAGFSGFLGNLDALYDRADAEGAAWRNLVAAWWQKHADAPVPASDLYPLVAETEADLLVHGRDDVGRKRSFGKSLARVLDRVFSVDTEGITHRFQVADGGVRHKSKLWKLAPVTEVGVLGVSGVFCNPSPHAINSNSFSRAGLIENPQNTPNPHGIPPLPTFATWNGSAPFVVTEVLDERDGVLYVAAEGFSGGLPAHEVEFFSTAE